MFRRFCIVVLCGIFTLIAACGGGDEGHPVTSASSPSAGTAPAPSSLAAPPPSTLTSLDPQNPSSSSSSSQFDQPLSGLSQTALIPTPATSSVQQAPVLKGYVLSTVIWPANRPIGVCWEMSAAEFAGSARERGWVQRAVADTWVAHSGVSFSGWNACTPAPDYYGIRVAVRDENPYVSNLGIRANNKQDGMVLNFTFANWSPICQKQLQYCISAIAAHEFGHVLGFAHEQNRPDTPFSCKDAPQGPSGDTLVGAWDLQSVMNYCNPHYSNDGKLSATDIQMVQRFYGMPPTVRGSLYVATQRRSPNQRIIAYDISTQSITGSITLSPNIAGRLISEILASPDGKHLYVVDSLKDGTSAQLSVVDTASNQVIRTLSLSGEIRSMEMSPDSNTLYVLTAARTTTLRMLDVGTYAVIADIPVPQNSSFIAKPTSENDAIYLMTFDEPAQNLIIAQIGVPERQVTRLYPVGTPSSKGINMALSVDGKRIYFIGHPVNDEKTPMLASLDLISGVYVAAAPFPPDAKIANMQVLDDRRVLYGNGAIGQGPGIIDLETRTAKPLMAGRAFGKYESEPYVISPDGKLVLWMSNGGWLGRLDPQGNDVYRTTNIDMHAVDLYLGMNKRPFAFAKLN